MIGLDTNVVLRYLLHDARQSRTANRIIESLSVDNPGYISIAVTLEIVWVLRSLFQLKPKEITTQIEHLLAADAFTLQNEQQVFEAAYAMKRDLGEFEDALIGSLNAWAGCTETVTFDKGTQRLPNYHLLP